MKFALVHLSGRKRGETQYFDRSWLSLGSDPVNDVVFSPDGGHPVSPAHAELFQTDCEMRLRSRAPDVGTLLNDVPVDEAILADKDIIRLGQKGPKLRFRIRPEEYAACKLAGEILRDARDVAAEARLDGEGPIGSFVGQLAYDLRRHSSRATRLFVLGLLVLLLSVVVVAIYSGYKTRKAVEERMAVIARELESARRTQADFERRIAEERTKLAARQTEADRLVALLEEQRRRGASPEEVRALTGRLKALERERSSAEELIKRYGQSVCFLYIAFGFAEKGRAEPVQTALMEFMGTGFLADDKGHIVTNRHVTDPWTLDPSAQAQYEKAGLEAKRFTLLAYFPGRREPHEVTLIRFSDVADLALGKLAAPPQGIAPIPIRRPPPPGVIGEAVVLLGYPAGVEGVLARMDDELAASLLKKHRPNLRALVQDISDRGAVRPLATQGHIADIVPNRIVYDALTTGGGSGSPVFNSKGELVAVNAAVMTRFGGVGFGVPIGVVVDLLAQAP
jgi:S1-C subfamily serine protease